MLNSLNRNTTKIEKLYALAEENGIPIDESCPENILSMSVRLPNGRKIIGLSKENKHTEHTRLECIAHEMGHCMTDSFYLGYSPLELRAKHEMHADRWAVNRLIPFRSLCSAVKNGHRELWELADHFGVSPAFVEKAIKIHEQNGNTVPKELYEEAT